MSILQQPSTLHRQKDPVAAALWFALYLFIVLVIGALFGAWLVRLGAQAESGFWSDFVGEQRGDRIMRRIQTLIAVLMAPLLLKKIGWEGLHDLGWDSMRSWSTRRRDFYRGWVLGFLAIGLIFAISLYLDLRQWEPFKASAWLDTIFYGFLVTGLGVGIIEETLTRGVLYRSMARCWTPWGGALISSAIFAYVHFLKATPESIELGIFPAMVSSMIDGFRYEHHAFQKFVNLFLFGVVLCRMVHHRGDIWYAVGLHASAVGLIRFVSKLSDRYGDRHAAIGHSAKFDDGWLLTVMLVILILGFEIFRSSGRSERRHVHF
ncbi:MAG: CPBP family intramembrane metalloprotease [Verrucomicrobia bacterium]|nr:CPBP family intramembrane metalloprotease [Verrucomicrobiota bacterium]MCH8510447.1 CPBP family intramembrane metalloprotease [Kiritimatiellia bacterium]